MVGPVLQWLAVAIGLVLQLLAVPVGLVLQLLAIVVGSVAMARLKTTSRPRRAKI